MIYQHTNSKKLTVINNYNLQTYFLFLVAIVHTRDFFFNISVLAPLGVGEIEGRESCYILLPKHNPEYKHCH